MADQAFLFSMFLIFFFQFEPKFFLHRCRHQPQFPYCHSILCSSWRYLEDILLDWETNKKSEWGGW